MASETPASRESQEQSIKARKHELFQAESAGSAEGVPKKTIKEYLRDTRPMPMTQGVKAALWVAAVLVALLFLAALVTVGSGPHRRVRRPRADHSPNHSTQTAASILIGRIFCS